jgi:hypothetical protein
MNTDKTGVDLDELPVGALLDVETTNTVYRIENRGDGDVLISGHPDICPQPVPVKLHFIGRNLRMEFFHPQRGIVRTSRVTDIHALNAA